MKPLRRETSPACLRNPIFYAAFGGLVFSSILFGTHPPDPTCGSGVAAQANAPHVRNFGNTLVGSVGPLRDHLTTRLTDLERGQIERGAVSVSGMKAGLFAHAIRNGRLRDGMLNETDAPYVAYRAYIDGQISQEQLATLQLRWGARMAFGDAATNASPMPLFLRDRLTPLAQAVLELGPFGLKPDGEIATYASRAQALPVSEQQFWILDLEDKVRGSGGEPNGAEFGDAFWSLGAFMKTLFSPVSNGNGMGWERQSMQLVLPSFSMMQIAMDVRYGDNALYLIPEFGTANSEELLAEMATGGRALTLPFPDTQQNLADPEANVPGAFFPSIYDFYRAYRGSAHVPDTYRELFSHIALLMDNYFDILYLGPVERPIKLFDGGYHVYIGSDSIEEWKLSMATLSTPSAEMEGFGLKLSFAECVTVDFGVNKGDRNFPVTVLILQDMVKQPEFWKAKGLDPEKVVEELGGAAPAVYSHFVRQRQLLDDAV